MSQHGSNVEISQETAAFLLSILNAQTLQVGAPDFKEAAHAIMRAAVELQGAPNDLA